MNDAEELVILIDEKAALQAKIKDIPESTFDGHTDFCKLTNEQKLEWLSSAAEFFFLCKRTDSRM